MKLACVQVRPQMADIEGNLATIEREMKAREADLLVFSEMFLTGYVIRDALLDLAIRARSDDHVIERLSAICKEHGKGLVVGAPIRSERIRGQIHNAALVFDENGEMSRPFFKVHTVNFGPFDEAFYFTPGPDPHLFTFKGFRFGVIICYDIFFPELCRLHAIRGADMVICISASPTTSRHFFELLCQARAAENTVYFAYSNLVGMEDNMMFWGGSRIVGPRGNVIIEAAPLEEDYIESELSLDEVTMARRFRPVLRDLKPQLFSGLSRAFQ